MNLSMSVTYCKINKIIILQKNILTILNTIRRLLIKIYVQYRILKHNYYEEYVCTMQNSKKELLRKSMHTI